MKYSEMKTLTPYRVIKGSSDGTLCSGDVVWISKNESLNIVDGTGGCSGGWLDKEEWINDSKINNFEVKEAEEFKVEVIGKSEYLVVNYKDH